MRDSLIKGASHHRAPGVYLRKQDAGQRAATVRMDVTAFVGLTERGPVGHAVTIESWDQFRGVFGRTGGDRQLPEAVYHFFENGGRRCVIVRVVHETESSLGNGELPGLQFEDSTSISVSAAHPGPWAETLEGHVQLDEYALAISESHGDWIATRDRRPALGSIIRLSHVEPNVGGSRGLIDQWTRVVETDESRATRKLRLVPAFGQAGSISLDPNTDYRGDELVIGLELQVPHRRESFDGLGLTTDHPDFFFDVVEAESSLVQFPPQHFQRNIEPVDEVLGEFHLRGGSDGADVLQREDFWLDANQFQPAGWDDGEAKVPREAILDYDEGTGPEAPGHATRPVAQLAFPDLMHPVAQKIQDEPEPEDQTGPELTFVECDGVAATRARPAASTGYPKLSVRHNLGALGELLRHIAAWCERTDRVALFDLPPGSTAGDIIELRRTIRSQNAAVYGPWIRTPSADAPTSELSTLPPCGAVAGIIARKEAGGSVGTPPANAILQGVSGLEQSRLPSAGFLHDERVNLIRRRSDGWTLMGSRTTDGDTYAGHVNVRRILNYLKRQLPIDASWATFQPNDKRLWRRLIQTISRRLKKLYHANALQGARADEAFFVRCDRETNPPAVLDDGRVVALIGVAVAVPAEFIELEFSLLVDGRASVEVRSG